LRLSSPRTVSLLFTAFFLGIAMPVYSASVTLGWDASLDPNLDHYVVYWRTSSSSYPDSAIVPGDTTNYIVTGLAANTKHYFAVTAVDSQNNESGISREVSWMKHDNPKDGERDLEWGIISGELKGFTILFSSNDLVPTLGDSSEIPPPNLPDVNAVGLPLNLQTEPQGVSFTTPVTIFIPCPGFSDVSDLDVYYYEDGSGWVLASDADDPGTVQPDAANWMVEGSRVNHNNGDPSTIEIQAYHFSGVQAGSTSGGGSTFFSSSDSGSGGGCFIATAGSR
jgi:hypothetical protein